MHVDFTQGIVTPESVWRAIILYGANSATYKFAFGRALLETAAEFGKTTLTLADIAPRYSALLCEALKREPRQATSKTSKFLDACRSANNGEITEEQLWEATERLGFVNVVDAFPRLSGELAPITFYENQLKDSNIGGLVITDATLDLATRLRAELDAEAGARHRLVETAWSMGVYPDLLGSSINFDHDTQQLVLANRVRRRPVTGARDALNGYQDGRCAYCDTHMSMSGQEVNVEHVLPFVLKEKGWRVADVDQVWNLVLACSDCNGAGNKGGRAPVAEWMPWLEKRNEDLIDSKHPLRETLMRQTGATKKERQDFLRRTYTEATTEIPAVWRPARIPT